MDIITYEISERQPHTGRLGSCKCGKPATFYRLHTLEGEVCFVYFCDEHDDLKRLDGEG